MTSERGDARARLGAAPPLKQIAGTIFGALTGLRRRRIFHPEGAAFEARVRVDGAAVAGELGGIGAGWLRAIARFSRGAGLPQRLPDVLGLALSAAANAPLKDVRYGVFRM